MIPTDITPSTDAVSLLETPIPATSPETDSMSHGSTTSSLKTDISDHVIPLPDHVIPLPDHVIPLPDHVAPLPDHVAPLPDHVPRADMVGLAHDGNKVSLVSNKADMTKIKTQLETEDYVTERNGWADKIAQVECHNLAMELSKCIQSHFWFKCSIKALTYQTCMMEAADLFKEEYDKVKIKEYIRLMEENKVDGSVIEPTDNFVDSRLFTNK